MKGISCRGKHICFGGYALQALEPAWITVKQIEAGRRAMTRYALLGGKIWVRIFPDKPVTVRPTKTLMGSGKGSPEYWISIVKPADNSGAQELMCIRIKGTGNHRYAHIGDIIVVVIKEAVPNMPLERSEVIRAVIVHTCKELKRDNDMIIRYDDNAAVECWSISIDRSCHIGPSQTSNCFDWNYPGDTFYISNYI
ncbi:hypothetical protein KSP40_PGU004050 [Platanthera guangdongensis]|uniref:50S ribosomal protein L16, chloroplastic n=1 Tax=Platanthera guangdongensis TaxID=2320717 RepID=A0ABR2M685_9ASPA